MKRKLALCAAVLCLTMALSPSAFAGNPYFIDYRLLADTGLLTADEVPAARPVGPIDYGALYNERPVILKKAADRLLAAPSPAYEAFCEAQSFWPSLSAPRLQFSTQMPQATHFSVSTSAT